MEKNLRLMTLMVVMFLMTIFTTTTKAQVNLPVTVPATNVAASDIEYEVAPDGILKWYITYWPKLPPNLDVNNIKANIATILNDTEIIDLKTKSDGIPRKITVLDNGFEVKIGRELVTIDLADLDYDKPMGVKEATSVDLSPVNKYGTKNVQMNYVETLVNGRMTRTYFAPYRVQFNKDIAFCFNFQNYENAKKIADFLYMTQRPVLDKKLKTELTRFESISVSYRALKLKPPVSEDQRRYIVQANAANKLKQFSKAIELYNKAIEIDETAYPAAYLNVALLQAQKHKINEAIFYMKKFLLLEPESADARSAQDRIYEWEGML